MRKIFMWRQIMVSEYGVRSLVMCTDRNKLACEVEKMKSTGLTPIGEIEKSGRYYCSDGNTDIHVRVN